MNIVDDDAMIPLVDMMTCDSLHGMDDSIAMSYDLIHVILCFKQMLVMKNYLLVMIMT
jgi:hypothetical protein